MSDNKERTEDFSPPPCKHSFGFTDEHNQLRCVACNKKLDENEWGQNEPDEEIGAVSK